MELTLELDQLKKILEAAFDAGHGFSYETRDDYISQFFDKEPMRLYSVEELRDVAVGTRFRHPTLGLGVVKNKESMTFGASVWYFIEDVYPWNISMKKESPYE